jgi:DNA-directed RNA polymerase I, II, and III subunit RPABC1
MDLDQGTILYRVRKTILQMLKDRGYLTSEKKLSQTKAEFLRDFSGQRSSLNMLVTKRRLEGQPPIDDGSDKILVFFLDNEKMNEMDVKRISATMIENDVLKSIVIIKGSTQVSRRVFLFFCFL